MTRAHLASLSDGSGGVFFANVCQVDRVRNEAVWVQPLVRALGDVTAIRLWTIEEATPRGFDGCEHRGIGEVRERH